MKHWSQVAAKQVASAVKELGANGLVLSTDLGQQGNMMPVDGIENMIGALKGAGVSDADLDTMLRKNPARLLGLSS